MKKVKISKKLSLTKETVNRLSEGLETTRGGVLTVGTTCGSCCISKCNTIWTCSG